MAVPSRFAMRCALTSARVALIVEGRLHPDPVSTSRQLARIEVDPERMASAVSQLRTAAAGFESAGTMRASSAQMAAFAGSDNVYYVYFSGINILDGQRFLL